MCFYWKPLCLLDRTDQTTNVPIKTTKWQNDAFPQTIISRHRPIDDQYVFPKRVRYNRGPTTGTSSRNSFGGGAVMCTGTHFRLAFGRHRWSVRTGFRCWPAIYLWIDMYVSDVTTCLLTSPTKNKCTEKYWLWVSPRGCQIRHLGYVFANSKTNDVLS